jgi:3-phenylpropionate/trans-cinnamate dioxygenase ferredoxin reductase subunit
MVLCPEALRTLSEAESKMSEYPIVMLGGGVAAGYAIQAMVEAGLSPGTLCVISAENKLPYERPPLSKTFLAGKKSEDDILINSADFYESNGIEIRLETVAGHVDFVRRAVYVSEGPPVGYERLLIATGSRPRRLSLPGGDLDGIHYLRTLSNAKQIRQASSESQQAVVIGGSFIGMEVASVLCKLGLETTMVFPEDRVWQAFFTPEMSKFFEEYYRDRGVHILAGDKVTGLSGEGRVSSVKLASGKILPADLVVAGIGVVPNTEIFGDSALQIDDGIVVNRFLETSVEGVFAAGDVARYPDALHHSSRRIEHWDNARAQGEHVGRILVGERKPFTYVPYFFSDIFDLSYEFWGDASETDHVIYRGDLAKGAFSVWWLKDQRLQAAFVMDRPDEERTMAQEWISEQAQLLEPDELADDELPLANITSTSVEAIPS